MTTKFESPVPFDAYLETRVHQASQLLRQRLATEIVDPETLPREVLELSGVTHDQLNGVEWEHLCAVLETAYAMGISVGREVPWFGARTGGVR